MMSDDVPTELMERMARAFQRAAHLCETNPQEAGAVLERTARDVSRLSLSEDFADQLANAFRQNLDDASARGES